MSDTLGFCYEPIYSLKNHKIKMVEQLARVNNNLASASFLQRLEENPRAQMKFDLLSIEAAYKVSYYHDCLVTVNLFPDNIEAILEKIADNPIRHKILIELHESIDVEKLHYLVEKYKSIRFLLDDFTDREHLIPSCKTPATGNIEALKISHSHKEHIFNGSADDYKRYIGDYQVVVEGVKNAELQQAKDLGFQMVQGRELPGKFFEFSDHKLESLFA